MARKTDQERLALLLARRNRADAEIRRLKAKNEKLARAQDARRKIVAGALALEHAIRNPSSDFAPDGENLTDNAPIANNAGSIAASAE